jgi:hypothetical protein
MMDKLKEFMMLFRLEPRSAQLSKQQEIEMHKQWNAFIGNIASQGKLVSTYRLGVEGRKISTSPTIERGIYSEEKKIVGGNMVVKAASIDEAADLGKKCPIIQMGGMVEIRDIEPMN